MANEFLDQNGLKQVWYRALELFSPKKHSHKIEDTTDLQSTLDGKAALSHTHDEYVTKEEGKELFTDEEREKLSNIENNAQVNKIESISLNNVPQSVNNKNVNLNIDLSPYAEKSELEETNENLSDLEREVADWYSKGFDYTKLTDEEKSQIKQDVTTVNAQFSKVYNVNSEQLVFPIDIERYAHGLDILEAYINGMRLVEGIDYSNDGQRITLTKPLNVIGQLEIVVFKSVSANVADWDSFKGERGERGETGKDGVSISSVVQTKTSTDDDGNNEITVTLSNGQKSTFTVQNGSQGSQGIRGETGSTGNGISSIAVSESTADGGNNVVTILMTDGTSKTFNVKNGSKGADGSGGNVDLSGYLPLAGGTMEGELHFNGGDGVGASKISLGANGQITDASTSTLFGRMSGDSSFLYVGSSGYGLKLRGKLTRPLYNGSDMALKSDIPTSLPASDVYTWAKASSKPSYSASEVGAVPTSRTVNGKALSGNITLSASDVGAGAKSTYYFYNNSTTSFTLPSMSVGEIKLVSLGNSNYEEVSVRLPSGGTYAVICTDGSLSQGKTYSGNAYIDYDNNFYNAIVYRIS